jgi:hypothetical protein
MSLNATIGYSTATDGREAVLEAVRSAQDKMGRAPVQFGWIIASHVFSIQQVLSGALDLLGDVPLIGFSSSAELTPSGRLRRSVTVALLSGDNIQGRAGWWPEFAQDSRAATQSMLQSLRPDESSGETMLVAVDGLNGDAAYLCDALSEARYPVAGCLAGGELWRGRTFQLGGGPFN